MRIIAGTFRSRHLKSLKGLALRPTSDQLRETLFNILGPLVEGSRFLDLFAGTGAVGMEAVSRGAALAVFVENHPAAIRLIRENLAALEIDSGVRVIGANVAAAIAILEKDTSAFFDIVFLDPPYADESQYDSALEVLEKSRLLSASATVIAEHRKSLELPAALGRFERVRVVRQGDAALSFYRLSDRGLVENRDRHNVP